MSWYVSRQCYWGVEPEDAHVVEIAQGGLDYANPDMLTERWPALGEGKEFTDPRAAVEAAIAVCEEWKKVEPRAQVAMGATGGSTMPFEPDSYENLRKRAEELYEKLPKCAWCGELLGKTRYRTLDGDEFFCREFCAEANQDASAQLNVE